MSSSSEHRSELNRPSLNRPSLNRPSLNRQSSNRPSSNRPSSNRSGPQPSLATTYGRACVELSARCHVQAFGIRLGLLAHGRPREGSGRRLFIDRGSACAVLCCSSHRGVAITMQRQNPRCLRRNPESNDGDTHLEDLGLCSSAWLVVPSLIKSPPSRGCVATHPRRGAQGCACVGI
jgi:hypothetical protein